MNQKEFLMGAKKYFEEQIRLSERKCEENRKRLEIVNQMLWDNGIAYKETNELLELGLEEDNNHSQKAVTRANLTPTKIEDGYAECDVRLVAGRKQYAALPQDGRTSG